MTIVSPVRAGTATGAATEWTQVANNAELIKLLDDADAVEGVMIKRAAAPYLPGRVRGEWFKWKRDPHTIDAVLMYAQRGHGKRSSFYSDFTFGAWREGQAGPELVPVGKGEWLVVRL